MKKLCLVTFIHLIVAINIYGQPQDSLNAIKLFVDAGFIADKNASISQNLQNRLYRKVIQLINQTGIVEIGYSTFLVLPRFDVLSVSASQAGISQVFMAECELSISINRADLGDDGGAVFNSFSKSITGSGLTKDDAIINALNSLSPNDQRIIDFLNQSKQKINTYFKTHCKDVIKEAERAQALKAYARSIALFFSIPSNAPCYKVAFEKSKGVYVTYVEDECNKKLVLLNSYVALSAKENNYGKSYYDSAMNIMRTLSPASDKCYVEAIKLIEKVENRLTAQHKEEFEIRKKLSLSSHEVQKEMYKAMANISSTYHPPTPSTNVIIAK